MFPGMFHSLHFPYRTKVMHFLHIMQNDAFSVACIFSAPDVGTHNDMVVKKFHTNAHLLCSWF